MALKTFAELFKKANSDEIKGEFIIYDLKGKEKQDCKECKDNKEGHYLRILNIRGTNDVFADCVKCNQSNAFTLKNKCKKIVKKEEKS